jgi:hypothetical protein
MKLTRKHWLLLAVLVVVLAAFGGLPGLSVVHVRGPDGDLTVQHAGPGGVHVQTGTADIRVNRP